MDQVRLIDHQVALGHLQRIGVRGVPVRLELLMKALQLLGLTFRVLLGSAKVVHLLAHRVGLTGDRALGLWHLLASVGG